MDNGSVSGNEATLGDAEYVCGHSDDCGYSEAVEGEDCKHTCERCDVKGNGAADNQPPQEECENAEEKSSYDKAVDLFTALPDASALTAENRDIFIAQLNEAMNAFGALTADEQDLFLKEHLELYNAAMVLNDAITGAIVTMMTPRGNSFEVKVGAISGATGNNSSYTIITQTSPSTPEKTAATAKAGEMVSVTLSTTRSNRAPQAVQFCNAATNIIEIEGHPITRSYDNPSVFTFTMPAQNVNLAITYGITNTVHARSWYTPSGTATPASADNTTSAVAYTSADPLSGQFMAEEGSTIDGYLYKFSDGSDYGTVDLSGTHLVYTPNAAAANKKILIHVKAFSGGGISGGNGSTAYVEHQVTVGALPIPEYSKDVSLTSLTYQIADGANGTVSLESGKYEYSITLPFGTAIGKAITLQPTLTDSMATVSSTASGETTYAGNNTTVTVTAQDPSVVKEYKVRFHVAPDNVPYSVTNKDTGETYEDDDTILINTESTVWLRINHGSGTSGTGAMWVSVEDWSVLPYVGMAHSGIYPNTLALVELKAAKAGDTKLFIKFYAENETIFDGKTPIATITLNLVQSLHKPVTNITDAPTVATVGTDLALTGTVAPADATNKVIEWSVTDAGTTNATIVEGKLKATAAGTVKVTATITNGLTASSNFTKDFDITVGAATLPEYSGTQAAPPSSTPIAKTATSITLTAVTVSNEVIEYGVSTSATAPTAGWQDSTAFAGLTADTPYYFFARVKANAMHKAGTASAGTEIKTDKSDAQKAAAAKLLAETALANLAADNSTTAENILSTVSTTITTITGATATWQVTPTITPATESAAGSITGTIVLACGSDTVTVTVSLTIPQLAADKTALTSAISAANNVKGTATVNDNAASSVTNGTKFVTTAEMNALTDAIAAAQAIVSNPASTTAQVEAAVIAINNAVGIFTAAIKTGTYTSTGGDSTGSGSSSGGSTTTPSTKPTEPVTGESKSNAAVDNEGNATVNVTDQNISDAVRAAHDAANKKGVNAGEVTAVINVTTGGKAASTVSVNLPKTVQEQVISSKIGNVVIVIDKPNIAIGMNLATVTDMNRQANADIQISATAIDATKLSTEAKNAIGNRPAFDLKATFANGSKSITSFGTGLVSVAIPYTLQKGEIAGGLYAVYVDGNGKVSYIVSSSYDAENKVLRFSTDHFSIYGISYKAPVGFTDIATHWAKTDIEFAVNRGLMKGTSNTTFAPNSAMTRGMFVTALGRLSNVDVNGYQTVKFTDVKTDTYYAPYVNWAAEKGIVKGTSDTTFAPDQAITRQEMATIMSSYAKALGYQVPETRSAATFADNGSIASWAAPAMKQMQMAGILNGKDGNKFDPTGIATRGEISAMLHRYVELVIDRTTTEGWTTNDSGSSLYYQSGKAVTGTKTISDVEYTFDGYGETTHKTATANTTTTDPALLADGKKYITHKIVKGDTLWDLARKHGTTVNAIVSLNNIKDCNVIIIGTEIKIPQK